MATARASNLAIGHSGLAVGDLLRQLRLFTYNREGRATFSYFRLELVNN